MAFPWLGSTTLLLLWACCTAEEAQNGCGPPPRRDREELADLSPKESYAHNEIVLYNCRPGYIKLGRFRMQCKNGQWEQAPPYIECKKKPCGHPGDAQYGSFELVEGDGFYFGARVVYRCDEGYQMLSRTNFRICRADGWSNDVPHCEITKCFPVKEPENGRIIQTGIMDLDQDFLFGHLLRFECADRYRIEGSDQIVCTAEGTWSAPVPKCVEVTCQPEHIDHGRILSARDIYKDGDKMQFSCDRGYKPAIRNEATCTRNGWNTRLECIEIVCLSPHVEHGDFRPKEVQYKYDDPIEIVCDAGFQSSALTSSCTEKGWQPPAICIPKRCEYIQIQNGRFYYNEPPTSFPRRLGSVLSYRCDSGFLPPNKSYYENIRCTRDGWDPEPKCLKICDYRTPFRNGKFSYSYWSSEKYIEGQKISYSCDRGFYAENRNTAVTCTKDGWSPPPKCVTWEELHPSCKNIAPLHGFFVNPKDKFSLNEKVAYRCHSGFTTKEGHEEGETQCLAEGWRPEPKCIKTCSKPAEVNAIFSSSKTTYLLSDILSYECKDGFETVTESSEGQTQCTENGWNPTPVCLPIECEGLALENGQIDKRQDNYLNGEVVQFRCLKKFTRVGPDSTQCYYFGWSPQPPICKEKVIPCAQPNSTIPHGAVDGVLREEYQHGEKVAYECDLGFRMTGSNTIECVDGEWTSLPTCTEEPKTCAKLRSSKTGSPLNLDGTIFKHNETVEYQCKGQSGSFIARCLHGKWELPSCTGECKWPKNTNVLQRPSSIVFNHNVTVNYSCHSGPYTTRCVGGKWSPEPQCPERCPPPPQLPNALTITETRNYISGEKVSYACMEHYVLKGPQKITCEGGRWQTPPRCVDTRCGDPPPIPHGEARSGASRKYDFGERVEYFCNEGFEIDGSNTATCEITGWSQLPNCKQKSCQTPFPINNASYLKKVKDVYQSGETVDYECHPGFTAEGPQTITCRRGEWSQPSTCEDASCRQPPVVENADVVEERAMAYLPGHELHYQCREGFEISGSDTVRCENKVWTTPPRCEDATCPPPPSVPHGHINGVRKSRYMPLEKVSYRCQQPYSLFGSATTMCLKKEWTSVPQCKVAGGRCDRPPSIDNGDILEMAKAEYVSGDRVNYKCQNLYRMEGNAEVLCYNGHWTQPPTCIARNCDYFHIPNGHVYGSEAATSFPKRVGDKHYYRCDSGFLPPNKAYWQTVTCTISGWDPEPNCFKKCEHTEPIRNGKFLYSFWTSAFIEGNTIFFSCDKGYYPVDETATATCTKDGWSPPPSCVSSSASPHSDATCREPPVVANADIVEERKEFYPPGHELHYQCHEGFEISGSETIQCENKVWSTPPRCEDATCPPPPNIPHGQINGVRKPRYMPLEKVSYRCQQSYSLFGSATIMCLKKEWTSIPQCKVAGGRCDRPPSIDNGDILEMAQSEYASGERVHYKCQNLYRMEGNAEVLCYNGHWTQPPTCIVPCTASEEDMKMNNIQLRWRGDSKIYSESGARVDFACRRGYRPDPSSPPFSVLCVDGRFKYPRCIGQA